MLTEREPMTKKQREALRVLVCDGIHKAMAAGLKPDKVTAGGHLLATRDETRAFLEALLLVTSSVIASCDEPDVIFGWYVSHLSDATTSAQEEIRGQSVH
jgi:hypothetical protein